MVKDVTTANFAGSKSLIYGIYSGEWGIFAANAVPKERVG